MIGVMDICINIAEGLLYAYLISRFVDIQKKKKIYFYIIYSFIICSEITLFNYFGIYDGLYSYVFIALSFFITHYCEDKSQANNTFTNLIYIIQLYTLISTGNEITLTLIYSFLGITASEALIQVPVIYRFICSRFFLSIIMLAMAKFSKKYRKMDSQYSVFFVFLFAVLCGITALIENVLYNESEHFLLLVFVNLLISGISLITYYLFCKSTYDSFQLMENKLLAERLTNIQHFAEEFNKKEQEIRTMRHDLKNQFTILNGYLDAGEIKKCQEQLKMDINLLEQSPVIFNTGKTAIDAIISSKVSQAKEKGIIVKTITAIKDFSKETEYDIALILGNLLDNAIENISKEKKEIILQISQEDTSLEINVKNTTDKKKVELETWKKDYKNHGIGLQSVNLLCEKHGGFLIVNLNEGYFFATAILKEGL